MARSRRRVAPRELYNPFKEICNKKLILFLILVLGMIIIGSYLFETTVYPLVFCHDMMQVTLRMEQTMKLAACVLHIQYVSDIYEQWKEIDPEHEQIGMKVFEEKDISVDECVYRHFGLVGEWDNKVFKNGGASPKVNLEMMKLLIKTLDIFDKRMYGLKFSQKSKDRYQRVLDDISTLVDIMNDREARRR